MYLYVWSSERLWIGSIVGQDFDHTEVAVEVVQPSAVVAEIIPEEIMVQMLGLIFCHLEQCGPERIFKKVE